MHLSAQENAKINLNLIKKHSKFALKQKILLHKAQKYSKIFYVIGVSKGTPFDTPNLFYCTYFMQIYPLVLTELHVVSDRK